MKIFITGGTGFIGSYLLQRLVDDQHEILVLKRKSSNLYRVADLESKINWIDLETSWERLVIEFSPDIIFNLAWNGVVVNDRSNWDAQISNIIMQQQLLDIAAKCGTKKFVGVGSQAEYGTFESKINEQYPANPNSAYGAVKLATLSILRTFCELNSIEWYWFRIFPCFGPMEAGSWLIPSLIKNMCTTSFMDLTGGEQKLAYLYVGEVANAIASVLVNSNSSGVYNICSNNPISLNELVTKIRDKVNPYFKLNFGALPYRYGQSMHMEGDIAALSRNLYSIKTDDFEQKLDETIKYYLKLYNYEYH